MTKKTSDGNGHGSSWDHTTHQDFYDYYAAESQSEATLQRFREIQAAVLQVVAQTGLSPQLDVADIGCGAGTQSDCGRNAGTECSG